MNEARRALTEGRGKGLPGSAVAGLEHWSASKHRCLQRRCVCKENVVTHCDALQPESTAMGFVSTAVCCVMGDEGAMGGGVGILQLRAGKHTQERFSLDEHNTTGKDECEIRLGPTCSRHHAVIAICKSNTSVWRLLPPRELPSATSVSRRISSTSQ